MKIISPYDASVLSLLVNKDADSSCADLTRDLGDHAKEIAQALTNPAGPGLSTEAKETARALRSFASHQGKL